MTIVSPGQILTIPSARYGTPRQYTVLSVTPYDTVVVSPDGIASILGT